MQEEPTLHPSLEPVAWLLGTFEGEGRGDYPTIEAFDYLERVTFAHVGTPVLSYVQRTWNARTGQPMHGESGYLRLPTATAVELVVAHTFGIAEVQEGEVRDGEIHLVSRALSPTATAKRVTSVRRRWCRDPDGLRVDVWMAYGHVPETHHLSSALRRTE